MYTFAQFVPLLIVTLIFAAISWPMVLRKGLPIWWIILCLIPGLGFLVLIYVASKTDKAVLDQLEELRRKIVK
jgi:cell division protein FtsW (lipid II flippase)